MLTPTPITADQVRSALTHIEENFIADNNERYLEYIWSDVDTAGIIESLDLEAEGEQYASDLANDEITAEELSDWNEEKLADVCSMVWDDLESQEYNGTHDSHVDSDLTYTADIHRIYDENTNECDEALMGNYGTLGDFSSIGEAIAGAVGAYLSNIAYGELQELKDYFQDGEALEDMKLFLHGEI